MAMVNLKINGKPIQVPEGTPIIEAARSASIEIPSLCYLKGLNAIGACRVCVVEVKGAKGPVASCVYPVAEGMEVSTNTPAIRRARKMTLELILSNHEQKCLSCPRSQSCELQRLSKEYGVDPEKFAGENTHYPLETTSPSIVRDNNKCVLCRRCVAACNNVQKVSVIAPTKRGFKTAIGCAFDAHLDDTACVACGQCIVSCPVGALREVDDTEKVWKALADPAKKVFAATAPAIRATLGECFDMPIGTNVEGKMVAALKDMGFDGVFDVDITADLTIMEEGTELIERLTTGGKLPLITSCSPGWINYCEHFYPELTENLSSCKSPQQMFGAVMKTYYAEKMGLDPKDIFFVSVMPCTAKKYEAGRPELGRNGMPDTDAVLTTREVARMIKESGIDFTSLPDVPFDAPLGIGTGAAAIFGVTGGVMEAALRTVAEIVTKKPLEKIEFCDVRGIEGIREASYKLGDITVNVAATSGLGNAKKLLDMIKSGEKNYHFVEIMGCPGGCINGGGQPLQPDSVRNTVDVRSLRAKALYDQDQAMVLRKSHESPVVKTLYEDYFEKPGSHKAHEILHTHYTKKSRY